MPEWMPLVATVVGALIVASGGWLTFVTAKRGADAVRMEALSKRADAAERKHAAAVNYASQLYREMLVNQPPPPPDWPADIFT